jgi:hypothetical protein
MEMDSQTTNRRGDPVREGGLPNASRSDEGQGDPPPVSPPPDPLAPILVLLGELGSHLRRYAMTWTDQARLSAQLGIHRAATLVVLLLIVLSSLIIGTSLLLIGIATGLGILFGQRPWLGQIVTGGVVVAVTFAILMAWRAVQHGSNWKQLHRRYDNDTTHRNGDLPAARQNDR